jgi:hypothetical protein
MPESLIKYDELGDRTVDPMAATPDLSTVA